MKIQVLEALASTPERPLWIWRLCRDGRLATGFSPSQKDAEYEAGLAQRAGHSRSR